MGVVGRGGPPATEVHPSTSGVQCSTWNICTEPAKRQPTCSTYSAKTAVWIGAPPPPREESLSLSRLVPVNANCPATMIVYQWRCCPLHGRATLTGNTALPQKLSRWNQNSIRLKNIVFILKQFPTHASRWSCYLITVPTARSSQFQGYWCQSIRDPFRSARRTTRAWLSGTPTGSHQRHCFPSTSCAVKTCLAPMSKPSLP